MEGRPGRAREGGRRRGRGSEAAAPRPCRGARPRAPLLGACAEQTLPRRAGRHGAREAAVSRVGTREAACLQTELAPGALLRPPATTRAEACCAPCHPPPPPPRCLALHTAAACQCSRVLHGCEYTFGWWMRRPFAVWNKLFSRLMLRSSSHAIGTRRGKPWSSICSGDISYSFATQIDAVFRT